MVSSVMDREGSTDTYRFGKSLRKKGFDAAAFAAALSEVVEAVEAQLAAVDRLGGRGPGGGRR